MPDEHALKIGFVLEDSTREQAMEYRRLTEEMVEAIRDAYLKNEWQVTDEIVATIELGGAGKWWVICRAKGPSGEWR